MKFAWDEKKEEINIKKHRVSFEDACFVFADNNSLSLFDEEHSDAEDRWITIGQIQNGQIIVVVHTYREYSKDELIRIISARKADRMEQKQYFNRKEG